jgi:DNA polymerase
MPGLDFETFSSVDIKRHGLAWYVASPDFVPLIARIKNKYGVHEKFDFVFGNIIDETIRLRRILRTCPFVTAHNASFERAVLDWLGIDVEEDNISIIDSAVVSRAVGAGSKLEAAAPQLLDGKDKIELGAHLIQVFCVPTKENQGRPYTAEEITADPSLFQMWEQFGEYCDVDAELSDEIVETYLREIKQVEWNNELVTQRMNDVGWYVDLASVHEMQRRYHINTAALEDEFRKYYDPSGTLNVNSYTQLQKWCAARGVKAKSFDQLHINKLLLRLREKMADPIFLSRVNGGDNAAIASHANYEAVIALLELKQELGGSSLSKLQTIIDMTSANNRLCGQYMHIGAGQSYRTSGRGVQLQNLPRLEETLGDMSELTDPSIEWINEKLARNIRQLFKAEDPDGLLIVGDFKSVESRGLAYIAGEDWKLDAYRQDKDIYKMLAMTYQSNAGVAYEDVTKAQRQGGKVGELACGYGAGPQAVADFAERMGILMPVHEAGGIVRDWRDANPQIVKFWWAFDAALHSVVEDGQAMVALDLPYDNAVVQIRKFLTPDSLLQQHPKSQSIELLVFRQGTLYLSRVFHGCYMRGRDVCYYKPSELKSGDLWRARMTQPPHAWYKLYGGKLTGILTQSFCRELFFDSLRRVDRWLENATNVKLIGQFHDEIVLEWTPPASALGWDLKTTVDTFADLMGQTMWTDFPLVADVKYAHRYIK